MAFFKSFQQNLPSVNISSILDSVTSRVDDLATAVSDATYAVSDQLTEQVTTIISKVQEDEEGENDETGQASSTQEGKSGVKSMWQTTKDSDGHTSAKNNQSSDTAARDCTANQLEWEWRDGCWRVKRTQAELEEEAKRKEKEKELQEQREQRRRERKERQREKEALKKDEEEEKSDDDCQQAEEEKGSEEQSAAQVKADVTPLHSESESPSSKQEENNKGEEVQDGPEREGDDEEELEPSKSSKKKKSDKKKGKASKEESKKSGKASEEENKKTKSKKGKKKKKKKKKKEKEKSSKEEAFSDSEEEHSPEAAALPNSTSAWSNKANPEQGGYSSEASSERANSIQRIKKELSLSELQPPPYQDAAPEARPSSRCRSDRRRGVRRATSIQRSTSPHGSSEVSEDHDTESYLNKGCEEDIPSDSTAVVGPEDVTGSLHPLAYEPEPFAKYGTLDVAFEYDSSEQWLAVTVTAATDIPALKQTGNISWQVHLVLLPTKKQRAKTGVQKGPCPIFTETFKFSRVEQDALGDYAVRFRLYSIRRMKKEKVLGEKVFYLTKLNLQGKMALPVTLEPGTEITGCSSLVSVSRSGEALSCRADDSSVPEILLGLIYNSTTGRLSAEVIQGSHFKTPASDKPVNTYVKLTMLDSKGKEMSKCKTAVCRGQPNPTYKETFVFQVALFQLSEVSLVVSVFCRRSSMRPRERLGWVSLGLDSTTEEQLSHWTEMKDAEGQQVCHWHTLTDT
ncbi:synaptotagmin-14b isoform X2 [Gouania willdenowi]|uniref:synaptotagmin-14b isoform X2 n=1 Tax=Gouania willdenowi TaxID=441366 RepID=UPI0010545001|nr:synaptotagmin-14-like isoform X2 [Gouania willdenowi]